MKSYRKELHFNLPTRRGLINITGEVQHCVTESGVREGLVLVNPMHITASVFINDDEGGLHQDFEVWLEKLAPEKPYSQYRHNGYEGQRRRAPQAYDYGPRNNGCHYKRKAGLRHLGANILL